MNDGVSFDQPTAVTMLSVHDDPAIRELHKDHFGGEGYDVVEASNDVQAIDQARRHRPAAVLMDLMIPIMSGAEATSRLKSDPDTAAIPVLAMSAGRNLTAVGLDIPADDFIPKRFDATELIASIAHHATSPANRA